METIEMICISCPKGCRMRVETDGSNITVSGNACNRGKAYARNEILNPVRMVTTVIQTRRAGHALLPIRTLSPVPKEKVAEILAELHRKKAKAPIRIGDVICRDVAGTKVDVIATKAIERVKKRRLRRMLTLQRFRRGRKMYKV